MKVLNLIQCTNLGGMERASLGLMRTLRDRGYRFELVSLNQLGPLAPLLVESGIPATGLEYGGRGGWKLVPRLLEALETKHPDALLMTGHHLLASLASWRIRSRRSVLAIHFHHAGVKPVWQWRLIYAIACLRFDAITFPTEFIREEAERIYPPVRRKAHTIYNPVVLAEPPSKARRQEARRRLGIPEGVRAVGNAGWLIPRKRWDVFLGTAQRVRESHPNTLFLVAGDGEERERLRSLAAELGLADHVRWLGWQQDLEDFYLALDVLLFHSDRDALGLTPLEAMSRGVPVVASVEHGGLHEIVRNGTDATLLRAHDVSALAAAVDALLGDSAWHAQSSRAGRARVAETCSPERTADAYARLFADG